MVSTVSLGLLAGPIAMASPASAATLDAKRDNNCSVTAFRPHADNGNGWKKDGKSVRVNFAFKIHCDKRTRVWFDQKMFQEKGRWDVKRIGHVEDSVWVHGTKYIVNDEKVSADRGDKVVKVFHTVRIQFKDNGKRSSWSSDFDKSPTAYIRVDNGRK
jgi:lipopolysaccharide export LptBFGC system permease protein LptF